VGSRKAAALVPVCDEQALADAIHNVCSDRRLYHAMSAEARSLADEYSWNRIGPRIVEVYQQGLCSDKTG
jgi:glycosyltransferase involved in cell wall biosynthesis